MLMCVGCSSAALAHFQSFLLASVSETKFNAVSFRKSLFLKEGLDCDVLLKGKLYVIQS